MHRFAHVGWIALLIGASIDPPRVAGQVPGPAATKNADFKQPSLIELARLYKDLDLPLPPKTAFFAIVDDGTSLRYAPASKPEISYQLHFATGGPYPKAPYWVWNGCNFAQEESLAVIFPKAPTPEAILPFLRLDRLRGAFDPGNESYAELTFAVQCHLLEHFELANFFYRRCQKSAKGPFDQTLIFIAWNYWGTELGNPKRDLAVAAKELRHIVTKHRFFELLKQWPSGEVKDVKLDAQDHQTLLDRLDLTLKPSLAKPGSVEALIDELLVDSAAGNGWELLPPEEERPQEKGLPSAGIQTRPPPTNKPHAKETLRNLGFAAVATLIEHVDDQRIVRHQSLFLGPLVGIGQQGANRMMTVNARSYRTIGTSVREILPTFLNLDEHKATKEEYLKAWNEIKSLKESDFVSKRLESADDQTWQFLHFCRKKYPDKLIEIYKESLRKNIDCKYMDFLIYTVAGSDLPKGIKAELLAQEARRGDMYQKYRALGELMPLDNALFSKLVVEILEKSPKVGLSDGEERWLLHTVGLGFRSTDPVARAASEKWTRGLSLTLKLEVLNQISGEIADEATGQMTGTFLIPFLEDSTIYDPEKEVKRGWITLRLDLPCTEVRNVVAMSILKHLNINIPVSDKTTEETWTRIRDLAKDEIDRRRENKSRQ